MLNLLYNPRFLPFLTGWLADRIFGDPVSLPHPVIYFGKAISAGEKILNKGDNRREKGAFLAITLILATFGLTLAILYIANMFSSVLAYIITAIGVFFCLAGKTLINEVRMVFEAVDRSTEEGRIQVGRIVGRDTANLSPQEIRAAALDAYSALSRQVGAGTVKLYTRYEMLDVVLVDGRARGIIAKNLVTGKLERFAAHAVVIATGGYGNTYFLSTNAMACNVTAAMSCYRKGAMFANPAYVQIHPTCIPVHGDKQSKLTLMSESLRNDGRIWVPKKLEDAKALQAGTKKLKYLLNISYVNTIDLRIFE